MLKLESNLLKHLRIRRWSFYKKEFTEKFFIFSSEFILDMSLILQHQQSPP